jgi:hypothetical protein
MKWTVLVLSIAWLTACAANDRSLPVISPAPIDVIPFSSPTRSVKPASTSAATAAPPAPLTVIPLIETVTPSGSAASPTPVIPSLPAATATLPDCPPLPAATETETQAAVQHFEHGLMFWLQARAEIWVLVASPLNNQFYWRVLPDLWVEGQPEVDPNLQPPAGRFQPKRGFGYAWRIGGGSVGAQQADLGWAIDEERGFDATLIYHPQGYYSPDCTYMPKSGIYEFIDDQGTLYQFVGAGGIARISTSNQ